MSSFENSSDYDVSKMNTPKVDFNIQADNFISNTIYANNDSSEEVNFDLDNSEKDERLLELYHRLGFTDEDLDAVKRYVEFRGGTFDLQHTDNGREGIFYYIDSERSEFYTFDFNEKKVTIQNREEGSTTVSTWDPNDTSATEGQSVLVQYGTNANPQKVLESRGIEVDDDVHIERWGEFDDVFYYQACGQMIAVGADGTVSIDVINVENAKRVHITNQGIHVETENGTWTFTEDGQSVFFGPNGEKYIINSGLGDLTNFCDITGIYNIQIEDIIVNKDGTLNYYDRKANASYYFDDQGRITKFEQGDVEVVYDYNPSPEAKQAVKDMATFYETIEFDVNFVATANIRGHEMKFYSIGDQSNADGTHYPIGAALAYERYNDRVLDFINQRFQGTIIGPWELSLEADDHDETAAYASWDKYIFVPYDACDYLTNWYKYQVPLHEMGHIVSHMLYLYYHDKQNQEGGYREDLANFYTKYKDLMPNLPSSGYVAPKYEESPTEEEFIADAAANYFLSPDEMKKYAPDLYEFLTRIYGEEEYYHYGY